MEEELVCALRIELGLPLDDITEVMRPVVNAKLSRSAIHRCLKRHGISARQQADRPAVGAFELAGVGFIHIDLKHLPALQRRPMSRSTAPPATSIWRSPQARRSDRSCIPAALPRRLPAAGAHHGIEFTDRFAVDKKNKPLDRPTSKHTFDQVCAAHAGSGTR